jgi:predicted RNA-binding protein with PIN domain
MATAVSLRSESSDHYIFAMDTSARLTVEVFCEELCKQFEGEQLEIVEVTSDQFEENDLVSKINDALEGE